MVSIKLFAVVASTIVSAVSASAVDDDWVLGLLKRQEPGTPAFACHSSCGTAITRSRGADPCNDSTFVNEYNACLACSGPSNINIWRFYGTTLTVAGTRCGFSTTPASGAPTSSTSQAPAAPQPVATSSVPSIPSPEAPGTTTTPPTRPTQISPPSNIISLPGVSVPVTPVLPSAVPSSSSVSTRPTSVVAPAPTTPVVAPTGTRPSRNGTSTSTASVQFTGGADSQKVFGMGAVCAAVLALMMG